MGEVGGFFLFKQKKLTSHFNNCILTYDVAFYIFHFILFPKCLQNPTIGSRVEVEESYMT